MKPAWQRRSALGPRLRCVARAQPARGFAIGTAFASKTEGLGLFVILAIALQNVPEGTSVAIPMDAAGFGRRQQFWAAVATSAPQPFGALIAFALVERIETLLPTFALVERMETLLPISCGFAAEAMLTLVAIELAPPRRTDASRCLLLSQAPSLAPS